LFLRNAWYAAIWSSDLAERPVARTVIGERLVLFRGASGRAAALADRCCHRAAPLSKGAVVGDTLRCGYHGLRFDENGRCVEVPIQAQIPAGAAVPSYPIVERHNVVWVWMGDRARVDPAKIPDLPWLDSPDWTTTPGYLHVDANAQLLIDNLLDFTHVPYVHPGTLAGDPREATVPIKTERLNHGVRVGRWLIDVNPPPLFAAAGGFTGKVDLGSAFNHLYRCRLRRRRHRRARRRPQPGHFDLVHPSGDTRERDELPLQLRLRAQFQARRCRDVAPPLRRLARHVPSGQGHARGAAAEFGGGRARRADRRGDGRGTVAGSPCARRAYPRRAPL
jgi:phenylpropionate dioxygenase-like ring-hydroxylating dioxygenase large terminal subunit